MADSEATVPGYADGLQRAEPREVGINAAAVEAFIDDTAAAGLDLHGLMLHRAGHVVAEGWWWPYRADRPRIMHSATKSVTACAIAMALEEGRFGLQDKVVTFFPECLAPVVDDRLAAMTIEDLLTMRAGHAEETSGSAWRSIQTSWTAEFFKIPIVYRPGTTYVYTSAASYMLSAILTKVTGRTLHEYLKPRLFEPLGIVGEQWDVGPDGVNPGGNGLTMKTADLLKLGVLHAQGGLWEGRRVLSEQWVAAATRSHGGNYYGYQWTTTGEGEYLALGVFVQMAMVFPRHGATLTITAAIQEGSKAILPIVHRHFPAAFESTLPADAAAYADARLRERLFAVSSQLALVSNPLTPRRMGGHSYRVERNAAGVAGLRFEFTHNRCVFHLTDCDGDHVVECGLDEWIEGHTDVPGRELHHGYSLLAARVVAGARWLDATTLQMIWIFVETAFRDTVICRFAGDRVTLDRSVNVNSSARSLATLYGVAVGTGG